MGLSESRRARQTRRHVAKTLRTARRIGDGAVVLGDPVVDAPDLEIGDRFKIWSGHRQTLVSGPGRIRIGHGVFINAGSIVYSEVAITIGDDVALANEVYVMDTPSHGVEGREPRAAPVVIGDGTWVGARAIVLPGVTIGSRVVVAAGAVVTRDVPDEVLVAGNPARVVRQLTYPPYCKRAWHDVFCYCPGSLLGPALP
jgi:acetyltransferase-like isoleucine patch superfamily enzyme